MLCLLRLWALGKGSTGPRKPWVGMLPAHCCTERTTPPPAPRLPPGPSRDSPLQSPQQEARWTAPHPQTSISRERLSHNTFFTMKRLLERSRSVGLPGDCPLVQALEEEAQRRLGHFSRKDVSVVLSSAMRLHPAAPTPLVQHCLGRLERQLGQERRPQTLFLLLSYYRLRATDRPGAQQQAVSKRQALRLVCHVLGQLEAAREHELGLIDDTLALCGQEASNKALEAIFSAPLFYKNRQERFVRSMADWFPGRADGLPPLTMALVAKYLARHRLREPPLLDSISHFLLKRMDQLDSKVIQRLVFPFSRLNYRPPNHPELFPLLESVLERRAGASPLAALNILMSLFQLRHFPAAALRQVFSPAFLGNVTSIPCGLIVRRYLSLLDVAVALELPQYEGPRLDPRYRVRVFDRALTADEANRKYSYKGLVGEALRQLVGRECFRQDEVLPPGYCIDFLLWISPSGPGFPRGCVPGSSEAITTTSVSTAMQTFPSELQKGPPCSPEPGAVPIRRESLGPLPPTDRHGSPSTSTFSLSRPTSPERSPRRGCSTAGNVTPAHCPSQEAGRLLPGPPISLPLSRVEGAAHDGPQEAQGVHRVVLSVNDKWHYCQNSSILVGSRAMRHRHLRLLGYHLVQLPYVELENVSGVEEAKQYLCRKLRELQF
ncbi:fas-activated serine/threonine kinase isoform X2 [Elgaria multicarinata webbii]|uniref:fas-activated serine/threonine kinase isoform X2 n=1 Tax=Elgaria multicarinata webbii TaxID=159646 RepID=UPI002FCD0E2E